ncbi:hypothetical protein GCM10027346_41930 [Hymenobacter seoulensis]
MLLLRRLLLLLPVLAILSCEKSPTDPVAPTPAPPPPVAPVPQTSRPITVVVGAGYDLSNTQAYGFGDSLAMDQAEKKLTVPRGQESVLYFLDKTTQDIMAVTRVDTTQPQVLVNAATVTHGLLDLLPAYSLLSEPQRLQFEREGVTAQPYKELVAAVDHLLKQKQSVYSLDPTYRSHFLALNKHLLKTYLGLDPPAPGTGGKPSGDKDMTEWITSDNKATLINQVHSYTKATFVPIKGGASTSFILSPDPVRPLAYSKQVITTLKDDCYTLYLNQTDEDVKNKNLLALTTKLTSVILGHLLSYSKGGGTDRNECIGSLTRSLNNTVGATVANAANKDAAGILKDAIKFGFKNANSFLLNSSCQKAFLSPKALALVLVKRNNMILNFIDGAFLAYDMAETLPLALSFTSIKVNLSETMQFYQGQHMPACVKVEKEGTLKASYLPEEVVEPSVKMLPQSFYSTWTKSGFTIKWTLDPGHGKTSQYETDTDKNGLGTVKWTLPKEKGNYALTAELKDKEGDHLAGSPLRYEVTVGVGIKEKWRMTKECNELTGDCQSEDELGLIFYTNDKCELIDYDGNGGNSAPITYPGTYTMTDKLITINAVTNNGPQTVAWPIISKTAQELVILNRRTSEGNLIFYFKRE